MNAGRQLRIGGIVLAAGQSRRFGSDKRMALLSEGEVLLDRAVSLMHQCVDDVALVIGIDDSEAFYANRFPHAHIIRSPRSAGGMGFTLADAVRQLTHWDAALVSLADKPFIAPHSLLSVRELLGEHDLVVPTYRRAWGHPVGFARQHFLALERLEGDRGARAFISSEQAHCLFVELDDPGIVADVDTPEQLQYWSAALATRQHESDRTHALP
jgi:molybdenum cofactor cytidylyltransferase